VRVPLCPLGLAGGLADEYGGARPTRNSMADHVALVHWAARWPDGTPGQAYARLLRLRPELTGCGHCIAWGTWTHT
jgi:hypothetical protein